jgi:nicotinamide-nucleotide amidase
MSGRPRPVLSATILSVGTEITTGTIRDTNAGELARALTDLGIRVVRLAALPDDLGVVTDALRAALDDGDAVVTTGGLGPTPDDLTREAIAGIAGEAPEVDPDVEAWLRSLWARRGLRYPESNQKQAWRIPSATILPNGNGTAPGWWVDLPDGGLIVALPGPPREMRPMWSERVVPRLRERGVGRERVVRTLRLIGIGESQLADELGALLRGTDPVVATYARADAVDIRITAVSDAPAGDASARRAADAAADRAEAAVMARVGDHVWGRDDATWPAVVGAALERLDRRLALVEIGTGGRLAALLADTPGLLESRSMATQARAALELDPSGTGPDGLDRLVADVAAETGAEWVLGLAVLPRGQDTEVRVLLAADGALRAERQVAPVTGTTAAGRATLIAIAHLHRALADALR